MLAGRYTHTDTHSHAPPSPAQPRVWTPRADRVGLLFGPAARERPFLDMQYL